MEKRQIENSIKKEDTISPVFWENFDRAESEVEKTQIISNIDSGADKMELKEFTPITEKITEINGLVLSEEIEDDIDDIDIFDDTIQTIEYEDTENITLTEIEYQENDDTNIISAEHQENDTEKENVISAEHQENDTEKENVISAEHQENDTEKENVISVEHQENDTEKENVISAEHQENDIEKADITDNKNTTPSANDNTEKNIEKTKISTPFSLEATQRLDTIEDKNAFLEMLQNANNEIDVDDLGDKNAYLDTFESENFEDEFEETPEDDIYYDEETSSAIYRAERKRLKIILFSSLTIGVIVFLVGYIIMGMHQRELREELQKQLAAEQSVIVDTRLVMVHDVTADRELSVHDINSDEKYNIKTNMDTKFLDRFRRQTSVTKIGKGDLVSIIMNDDGETAKEIYYSADTWMAKEVNGLSVNPEQKTVSIKFVDGTEQKTYHYTDDNLFLYKDGEIAPENIMPCDIITMQGRDNRVWSIRVVESHGVMTLKNEENIVNGVLTVDNKERFALEGFGSLVITEGVHKISVTGDNIESFEDTIFVVPRENFVYDLSNAQSKTGVVIIKANVYDFKLYINGADADGSKPIVLPLGDYDITISKNGYKKWNETITVVEPSITIDVYMEEDIQESVISFHSVPAGATIIWNGKEIGVTPLEHTVRYGVYTLEVVLEGYKPHLETVVVDKSAVDIAPHLIAEENTAENQLQ